MVPSAPPCVDTVAEVPTGLNEAAVPGTLNELAVPIGPLSEAQVPVGAARSVAKFIKSLDSGAPCVDTGRPVPTGPGANIEAVVPGGAVGASLGAGTEALLPT